MRNGEGFDPDPTRGGAPTLVVTPICIRALFRGPRGQGGRGPCRRLMPERLSDDIPDPRMEAKGPDAVRAVGDGVPRRAAGFDAAGIDDGGAAFEKPQRERKRSRRRSRTRSIGLRWGEQGRSGTGVTFGGKRGAPAPRRSAPSSTVTARSSSAKAPAKRSRKIRIASAFTPGRSSAKAALPPGRATPPRCARSRRRSCAPGGRLPRVRRRRHGRPFRPTRISSWNHGADRLPGCAAAPPFSNRRRAPSSVFGWGGRVLRREKPSRRRIRDRIRDRLCGVRRLSKRPSIQRRRPEAEARRRPAARPVDLRVGAAEDAARQARKLNLCRRLRAAAARAVVEPRAPLGVAARNRVSQRLPVHPRVSESHGNPASA